MVQYWRKNPANDSDKNNIHNIANYKNKNDRDSVEKEFFDAAVNLTKGLSREFEKIADGGSETTWQNRVWQMHSLYTRIKYDLALIQKKSQMYTQSRIDELGTAFEKLENMLAEKKVFEQLENDGFSLVPKSSETIAETLDAEDRKSVEILKLHSTFYGIVIGMKRGVDRIYSDKFRRFIMNSGERRQVAKSVVGYLNSLNPFLKGVLQKYDQNKYDLEDLRRIVRETLKDFDTATFQECQKANLKSMFSETRSNAEQAEILVREFRSLAAQLKQGESILQVVGAKPKKVEEIKKPLTSEQVDTMIATQYTRHQKKYRDWFLIFEASVHELSHSIPDKTFLLNPAVDIPKIVERLNYFKESLSRIPAKRRFYEAPVYTPDEMASANRTRAAIAELEARLLNN